MGEAHESLFSPLADDKGHSEETCIRCGWTMGQPPLNCQNDDSPHRFPSQEVELLLVVTEE